MTLTDKDAMDERRRSPRCDVCAVPAPQGCECHHIAHRGHGGGFRLDISWAMLSVCFLCHRAIEDGNPIQRGRFRGTVLREADQYEIVHHRDGIPLEVDLQGIVWLLARLDSKLSIAKRFAVCVEELDELNLPYAMAVMSRAWELEQ